jgi:hypothetical protein
MSRELTRFVASAARREPGWHSGYVQLKLDAPVASTRSLPRRQVSTVRPDPVRAPRKSVPTPTPAEGGCHQPVVTPMDDLLGRAWADLGRISGPMWVRLLIQPTVAAILGVRAGLRDARQGRPPYLWAVVRDSLGTRRAAS